MYLQPTVIRTKEKLPEWLAGLPGASSFSASCSVSVWEKKKQNKGKMYRQIRKAIIFFSLNGVMARIKDKILN